MNPELVVFNKILFQEFRPWMMNQTHETKFKEMHLGLAEVPPSFSLLYEVDFIQPLTFKRTFYSKLIHIASITYLNSISTIVSSVTNASEFSFWSATLLTKAIPTKFEDIERAISDRESQLEKLSKSLNAIGSDKEHQDNIFVLQCLKYHAIWIFLEVQELLKNHVSNFITEETIHLKYFSEPQPEITFVKQKLSKIAPIQESRIVNPPIGFQPIGYDFRSGFTNLTYSTLIKNSTRFQNMEVQLYSSQIIDLQYNFIRRKGNKDLLAAIYHALISKAFFSEYKHPGKQKIKTLDIRKYLDNRYGSDIDQQFRSLGKNHEKLNEIIGKHYWIENLLPC